MLSCLERKLFPSIEALGEKIKFALILVQLCRGKITLDQQRDIVQWTKNITLPDDLTASYAMLAFYYETQIPPPTLLCTKISYLQQHVVERFRSSNCAMYGWMKCGRLSELHPRPKKTNPTFTNTCLSNIIFHKMNFIMKTKFIWHDKPSKSVQISQNQWMCIYYNVCMFIFKANWNGSKALKHWRLADYCAFGNWVLDGQSCDEWSSYLLAALLHVRCYLTDPSSLVQLSASPASPFPEKREWVRPSLLVAKTLFHHQAQLCEWTGQDLALHASSIFSSPSLSP